MRKNDPRRDAALRRDSRETRRNAPPRTAQECASPELDELDRGIVHALQIHPRAPWTLVGEVLGVDPVTAARRWQRLEDAGLAWVTAHPRLANSRVVATGVIEVDTDPGAAANVARALAADHAVVNVKLTAGGRDVIAEVQVRDLNELLRLTTRLFQGTPRVRATRAHISTGMPTEGSRWRLRSLDSDQCARIDAALPPSARPEDDTAAGWDALDARLLELLSADGRMSMRKLAAATDVGLTTVRRRLHALLPSRMSLRCDLARSPFGWPQSAVYFASVPAQHLEETSRVLSGFREVRACAIMAGPHNLVVDVWLRGLSDVHAFEAHLARRLPRLTVDDRSLVLRTVKHMGRLLDEDGRSVGVVPLLHPYGPRPSDTSLAADPEGRTAQAADH
ncbi:MULTISPECIES: Lrp/AsnC family transcriptional regulator [Streptomyces]|uniref:Lrp/AsnC family transcriptional regulator n=1 Tax=Streptomyces lycopersici TaxID=2974589 RepID=UPI0021CF1487|nr:Lrp/AsnC family transcriptional regulator [Streptomyces sp. NEAU-383]